MSRERRKHGVVETDGAVPNNYIGAIGSRRCTGDGIIVTGGQGRFLKARRWRGVGWGDAGGGEGEEQESDGAISDNHCIGASEIRRCTGDEINVTGGQGGFQDARRRLDGGTGKADKG